jgi:hypothetical protein
MYRFLGGHETADHYVEGDEEANWEQNPTATTHNYYKGYNGPHDLDLDQTKSISSFCGGCHTKFHKEYYIGSSSPWMRHPNDFALPTTGEYAGYTPTTSYSPEAPVAWTDPTNSSDRGTPIVMCLSCHRPHGSQYPDMLRWDYDDMEVGATGAAADTGCFTCHSAKDGT